MPCAYSVVIPALNEARTIERAVVETKTFFDSLGAPYEIIVADDGSTDGTAAIVERLAQAVDGLHLVRLPSNRGKGAAVRAGVLASSGETVLFLDSDLSTHPSEFRNFIPHLADHDVLFGSRRIEGARITSPQPLLRVWFGQLFNWFIRRELGIPSYDTQCGFKAFRGRAKELFKEMKSDGWAFDVELILLAFRRGHRVKELPITWCHGEESRVRFADAFRILKEIRSLKTRS